MSSQGAEMLAVAAMMPAETVSAVVIQDQSPLSLIKEKRSRPISILKPTRPTLYLDGSATTPRVAQQLNVYGESSTSTLGKRPRSPNDLLSQLMDPGITRETQNGMTTLTKKQKVIYRVRWKSGGELEAIRIFEKDTLEEGDKNSHGSDLSHQEEGEAFKKSRPMLDWYQPIPTVIPQAYLQRVLTSADAGRVGTALEEYKMEEEESLTDVSVERSPTESTKSLPPDLTGLSDQTIVVYLPEELYSNGVDIDEESTHMYQNEGQMAQSSGPAAIFEPLPSHGFDNVTDSSRPNDNIDRKGWSAEDRYAEYSKRGSRDGGEVYRGTREREKMDEVDISNGRRTSIERASPPYRRYKEHNLPLPKPKAQTIHQRSASNSTRLLIETVRARESSYRSISNSEQSVRRDEKPGREGDIKGLCRFHDTPGGCTRRKCRYLHQ